MTSSTDRPISVAVFPPLKSSQDTARDSAAYTYGHTAGYTAGIRKAAREAELRRAGMEAEHAAALSHANLRTERALAVLSQASAALEAATVPVLADAQGTLADAALELAEAILGRELSDEPNSARAALARATAAPLSVGERTVRMHPADLSVLDDATRAEAGVVFRADESLSRGDAVTEFESGYLDARIATALDRARRALAGEEA